MERGVAHQEESEYDRCRFPRCHQCPQRDYRRQITG
ncbi:hypothetical protein [Megasphaera sp.]